ncbi:MAG: ABC transporter permease [Burkholderiales bacterium]|nr:ABC transporter permease [Burkholderiales bacterium]
MKLPLALRNLTRHYRRTAIALPAISFSVVAIVLTGGFFDWLLLDLRENTIQSRLGHVQIVKSGFNEHGTADPFAYLLPAQSAEFDALKALPDVTTVARRIQFTGVISHDETSVSFLAEGVEPDKEEVLSKRIAIVAGKGLSADDPGGILLGAGLAASLGVKPGDSVVLLSTAVSGGMNGTDAHVRGLFATFTKAYDDSTLRVPLPMAQKLLRTSGAHRWVVLLKDTGQTDPALISINSLLSNAKLQAIPWYELADFYNKLAVLFTRQINVIRVMIALVVLLSISNTLIMSVLERTGEIGTLMAMGSNRRRILQLFLSEGFFLACIGGVIGIALSILLAGFISTIGIPMPPPPGSNVGFTARISFSAANAWVALALVMSTTLLASIYPAWKASRLEIVDALRHNK